RAARPPMLPARCFVQNAASHEPGAAPAGAGTSDDDAMTVMIGSASADRGGLSRGLGSSRGLRMNLRCGCRGRGAFGGYAGTPRGPERITAECPAKRQELARDPTEVTSKEAPRIAHPCEQVPVAPQLCLAGKRAARHARDRFPEQPPVR